MLPLVLNCKTKRARKISFILFVKVRHSNMVTQKSKSFHLQRTSRIHFNNWNIRWICKSEIWIVQYMNEYPYTRKLYKKSFYVCDMQCRKIVWWIKTIDRVFCKRKLDILICFIQRERENIKWYKYLFMENAKLSVFLCLSVCSSIIQCNNFWWNFFGYFFNR